ncbi:hypothetical protein SPRG_06182 [Saprolegnia parasitica CBS 223.65]|uniref:Microsomal glutathione S-transferase 1 n=1 Tax=Saprolegnia parasitica (strain CBS 223.65) TaxID=695850 RepID=A0A067CQQ3_SAPPC|nr:hypothetical protein SPRG_06182 [Saprolegnia parasitica CBS 223.65]KDO29127.1 hypothetical protein SPRG_06182 [Saprolegnia parasitica CBS 223.65]|eukprot:XP_012200291.1 hypothetical protein SPRG_06182 [Saprolegnia parasitica CBS 223.65]
MPTTSPFQAIAICSTLLYAKYITVARISAKKKFIAGNRAPEDEGFHPGVKQSFGLSSSEALSPKEVAAKIEDLRWQRILANDVENIPLGLIMAWGAATTGGNASVTVAAITTFTAARFLHTIAYANGWLYPRVAGFAVGALSIFVLATNSIAGAFTNDHGATK